MSMANLANWEAARGYGVDALGRPSYQNQFSLGAGPRDHLADTATHNQLKAAAAQDDPRGMAIRDLLEQLKRKSLPGQSDIPVYPVAMGNASYDIRVNNAGPGTPP